MLRNDLKTKLGEDWRSKFAHRDCDQSNYEFGSFEVDGKKINLVLNPNTLDIMNYYYDDLANDVWIEVDLKLFGINISNNANKAWINKKYQLKTQYIIENKLYTRVRDLTKSKISKRGRYPHVGILNSKSVSCHRLIATLFIPNSDPINLPIINHKDKNSGNFKVENLEWCNYSYNSKKENIKKRESAIRFLCIEENKEYTKDMIVERFGNNSGLHIAIKNNIEWKGYHWEKVNITLRDYLSRHRLTGKLHKHPTIPNLVADECGVMYIDGEMTIGYLEKSKVSYQIQMDEKQYYVHRILIECYTGKLIPDDLVVDHIIPVTIEDINNSIDNLRLVTASENMNNTITKKNLSVPYCLYNLKGELQASFDSIIRMREYLHTTSSVFSLTVTGTNNITYIAARDEKELNEKINYIYYKINNSGEIVDSAVCIGTLTNDRKRVLYVNTGVPMPDGYYYQQGDPKNIIYKPDNKNLEKIREVIVWEDRNK